MIPLEQFTLLCMKLSCALYGYLNELWDRWNAIDNEVGPEYSEIVFFDD